MLIRMLVTLLLSTSAYANPPVPQLTGTAGLKPFPVFHASDAVVPEAKISPKTLSFPVRVYEEDAESGRLKIKVNDAFVWVERRHFVLEKSIDARCITVPTGQMTAADRGANGACKR